MNTDQFIAECQGYFGPYTATQKKYVRQWLEQHTESRFPLLFAEVLKTISPVYKTPPGIKDLEDAWKHVAEKFRPELAAPAVPRLEEIPSEEEREAGAKLLRETLARLERRQVENRV